MMARARGYVPFVFLLACGFVAFEWMDYHVKGKSLVLGVNTRCIDYFSGHCLKLDESNIPWDATAATWLFRFTLIGLPAAAFLFLIVAGVMTLIRTRQTKRNVARIWAEVEEARRTMPPFWRAIRYRHRKPPGPKPIPGGE